MKSKITSALLACSVSLFALNAGAQTFSIDWHTIAGGGTSTGGAYSLRGTLGQPDAGTTPMTNGQYSVTGGFWSLVAVQTTGAPLLKITLTSTNTAVVSWPSPSSGFKLEQNSNPSSTNWTTPSEIVTDNGTTKFITVSPATGTRFYRLFKP